MISKLGFVKRLSVVFVLAVVSVGVSGCSDSPDQAGQRPEAVGQKIAPSMKALFEQALQRPGLSQFEREVLTRAVATGKLSQADYEEAHSRYAKCMKDAGVDETYTKFPNGVYEIHPPNLASEDNGKIYKTVSNKCLNGMFAVETLYQTQQGNPELLVDQYQIAVRCLVKAGVAPADYTAESLKADQKSLFARAPYKAGQGQARACLWSAGFAVSAGG